MFVCSTPQASPLAHRVANAQPFLQLAQGFHVLLPRRDRRGVHPKHRFVGGRLSWERCLLPHGLFGGAHPAVRCHVTLETAACEKRHSFFEFSLCLSRACLGKMFSFIYKWRKKWRFSHRTSRCCRARPQARCRPCCPGRSRRRASAAPADRQAKGLQENHRPFVISLEQS